MNALNVKINVARYGASATNSHRSNALTEPPRMDLLSSGTSWKSGLPLIPFKSGSNSNEPSKKLQ